MKLLSMIAIMLMSSAVFAQICEVNMIDRYNRVVKTYRAYGDSTCFEGMRDCRRDLRFQPQLGGVDCIRSQNNPYPDPNPYPNPNPGPNPYAQPAQCAWFNGQSYGIAQRGWHAFRIINGMNYSLRFHGNENVNSEQACKKDIIFNQDATAYRSEVQYAVSTTCTCSWYDGQGQGIPNRGWHMTYMVNLFGGGQAILDAGFYQNNNTQSQQACNNQLLRNNFICPIR